MAWRKVGGNSKIIGQQARTEGAGLKRDFVFPSVFLPSLTGRKISSELDIEASYFFNFFCLKIFL